MRAVVVFGAVYRVVGLVCVSFSIEELTSKGRYARARASSHPHESRYTFQRFNVSSWGLNKFFSFLLLLFAGFAVVEFVYFECKCNAIDLSAVRVKNKWNKLLWSIDGWRYIQFLNPKSVACIAIASPIRILLLRCIVRDCSPSLRNIHGFSFEVSLVGNSSVNDW